MAETSLFGATPESIQRERDAVMQQEALQYAKLDPFQRATAGIYAGFGRIGNTIGGLLGGVDPEIQRATQRQELSKGLMVDDPSSYMQAAQKAAQMGDYGAARELSAQAQAMQIKGAQLGKTQAEQRKLDLAAQQEIDFRNELAALGANPSQESIINAAIKFGDANKVLSVVQGATDKEAARQQALEAAKIAADARIEAAKEAGANRLQIAQMQADSRVQIAQLTAALRQGMQGNKPLPASLQKEEGADLAAIDTYAAQQAALAPAIASLTPNAQGVRKLELGPVKNVFYMAQNAAGNSTPESRAYEGLKSAVDTAVNLQVSAEKGVQTDKDVLRFAQALVAAYGRNDSKATLEALTRYESSLARAAEKTQGRLESRRKSQNVEPYGFTGKKALGTPENPIKLD